jgi:hypothetical protein
MTMIEMRTKKKFRWYELSFTCENFMNHVKIKDGKVDIDGTKIGYTNLIKNDGKFSWYYQLLENGGIEFIDDGSS